MTPSLHNCSFQLLFAGRKTEAKIISTLMFIACGEVNEIQSAQSIFLLLKENMYQDTNDVPKAKWILCTTARIAALDS